MKKFFAFLMLAAVLLASCSEEKKDKHRLSRSSSVWISDRVSCTDFYMGKDPIFGDDAYYSGGVSIVFSFHKNGRYSSDYFYTGMIRYDSKLRPLPQPFVETVSVVGSWWLDEDVLTLETDDGGRSSSQIDFVGKDAFYLYDSVLGEMYFKRKD